MARDPHLCVLPLHSPRGGFPSSRGLASQKELLSLCDVGHWDPGKDRGGQRRGCTQAPAPTPPGPGGLGSPALRGGQGRHWAPQPRPWRQQQSSKVRVGPVRGPAHMPSSPRWAQHTSRRSGARSAEGDQASAGGPKGGRQSAPGSHPPSRGSHPRGSTQRTGPWNWPRTTLALTGWALRELAIAAGGPGHPGRAALAAVGARQVDAATRAAGCRVLALVYVYG